MRKLRTITELICNYCRHRWFPKSNKPGPLCPRCRNPRNGTPQYTTKNRQVSA